MAIGHCKQTNITKSIQNTINLMRNATEMEMILCITISFQTHIPKRFHSIQKYHDGQKHVLRALHSPNHNRLYWPNIPSFIIAEHIVVRSRRHLFLDVHGAFQMGVLLDRRAHEVVERELVARHRLIALRQQRVVHVPHEERHQDLPRSPRQRLPCCR